MASPAKVFNVGVIGYGLSAKVFHIPFIALTEGLRLHAIVQRHPAAANSAPADHPDVKHFTSPEPMLADSELDLVVVSTPPDTHYAFARAALEAGKHVLVEKPFVPTAAEADELVGLARQKGLLLCAYQNRRWDADFLTVRHLLAAGTLGRVYEFETHFDRFRPAAPTNWKGKLTMAEGGGVLYDLGVHIIDQVYHLFGMPTSVSAKFVVQREGRIVTGEGDAAAEPDSFTAVLSYADAGLLAFVRAGVLSVEKRQPRFWVRGARGSYHKSGLDPQEDHLRKGGSASDPGFGKEDAAWDGTLYLAGEDGAVREEACPNVAPETYAKLFQMLARALETGKESDLPVPASEAADVLRIIEAVKESARTGADVKVPRV